MKKTIYFLLSFIIFFTLTIKVDAASSLSAPSSVYNGSSFTIQASVSGVAAWEVHVRASGPVSGCVINAADSDANANNTSRSFSATCKATGTGTIRITMSGNTTTASGATNQISGSRTVNVTNRPANSSSSSSNKSSGSKNNSNKNTNNKEDSKSSDAALKSLMVEGKNLTPEFNKDVTSYNVTVDNDTKKIKINAEANDSKSTVTGAGEKDVKEGENKFDVVVTAENGDKKTYTINVTVDTKPIVVKVNGKKYTVVKKKEELPQLDIKHEDMSLNIEEQEIPAYRVDKLNYVLVGLKDSDGKVRLYIFESFKDSSKPFKYTLFRQLKFSQSFISYLEFPKSLIPDGYKKYKEKINDEEIEVYKLTKGSNYSLFYGINIETGEKSIYKYDSKENTIQRYDREELKALEKQMKENKLITIGFVGLSALLLIIIVLMIATKRIKKKKSVKYNKVLKQEKLKRQ